MKFLNRLVCYPLLVTSYFVTVPWCWAQEGSPPDSLYTFSFKGEILTLSVHSRKTDTGDTIIEARSIGGSSDRATNTSGDSTTFISELRVDPAGVPQTGFAKYASPDEWMRDIHATLMKQDSDGVPHYALVLHPEVNSSSAYDGTLLTRLTLAAFIGRIYDAHKGEKQFPMIVDYRTDNPYVGVLHLREGGKQTVVIDQKTIQCRRLRYQADFPSLKKGDRKGTLLVGSSGVLVQCDTRLLSQPYRLQSVPVSNGTSGEVHWDVAPPFGGKISVKSLGTERTVSNIFQGYAVAGLSKVSRDFSVLHHESVKEIDPQTSHFRMATFDARPTEVDIHVDASPPIELKCGSKHPLFFLQWFQIDSGANPLAKMTVGEKREVDYIPVYDGEQYAATAERLKDVVAVHGGTSVKLRQYRLGIWVEPEQSGTARYIGEYYDVYTDGNTLVAVLGSLGSSRISRVGWEDFTKELKVPSPPPAPNDKASGSPKQ